MGLAPYNFALMHIAISPMGNGQMVWPNGCAFVYYICTFRCRAVERLTCLHFIYFSVEFCAPLLSAPHRRSRHVIHRHLMKHNRSVNDCPELTALRRNMQEFHLDIGLTRAQRLWPKGHSLSRENGKCGLVVVVRPYLGIVCGSVQADAQRKSRELPIRYVTGK